MERRHTVLLAIAALSALACRSRPNDGARVPPQQASASAAVDAPRSASDAPRSASDAATAPADAAAASAEREIGPYEIPFEGARTVYYVVPRKTTAPARLLANLHGVCNPPGYACGYWTASASTFGFLVCPTGNAQCGPKGPPTWKEPIPKMDEDLEHAIAAVSARHPGEVGRDGAILTGFSLGAYAAYQIARAHPGRWPYLVLTEANVPVEAAALRAAGVRAVALIGGEIGTQIAGQRRSVERLGKQGFPARLWVMKGAGHHYSADIDAIMREAIDFVTSVAGAQPGDAAVSAPDAGR
jgi:hypothetical protein